MVLLQIKVNDKVKVYKKNLFSNKINEIMFGTVERIEEWKETDSWGELDYDCYRIIIVVKNKRITIEDNYTKMLFRKYEFEAENKKILVSN